MEPIANQADDTTFSLNRYCAAGCHALASVGMKSIGCLGEWSFRNCGEIKADLL